MVDKETYTAEEVEAIKSDLIKKHNSDMAQLRTKADADIEKAKKEATMSADERAKQAAKEENEAMLKELDELRSYKKTSELSKRIAKEGLPANYVYDTRLLSVVDDESALKEVFKTIKSEYATIKGGATTSTVIQNSGGNKGQTTGKYADLDAEIRRKLGM